MRPNYRKIFEDIISQRFPDKIQEFYPFLIKENFTDIDVIDVNRRIFRKTSKENFSFNQKHRSYDRNTIFQILDYQKKENMTNIEVAKYYGLSRNTISKWKKLFF